MRENKVGNWFLSSKGNQIFPLHFTADDVDIEDIAHSLSNICRFGGHCKEFYSVAQHSLIVSKLCSSQNKLIGLLHDATEAYVGDMVRPLKVLEMMTPYRLIEQQIWIAICEKFRLPISLISEVDKLDASVLLAEKRDLLNNNDHIWDYPQCKYPDLEPNPVDRIYPLSPSESRKEFLRQFYYLTGQI